MTVDSNFAGTFQKFSPAVLHIRHNSCLGEIKFFPVYLLFLGRAVPVRAEASSAERMQICAFLGCTGISNNLPTSSSLKSLSGWNRLGDCWRYRYSLAQTCILSAKKPIQGEHGVSSSEILQSTLRQSTLIAGNPPPWGGFLRSTLLLLESSFVAAQG